MQLCRRAHAAADPVPARLPTALQRRPELAVLSEAVHQFAAGTPVLEWFVRSPGGAPAARSPAFITDGRRD